MFQMCSAPMIVAMFPFTVYIVNKQTDQFLRKGTYIHSFFHCKGQSIRWIGQIKQQTKANEGRQQGQSQETGCAEKYR